MHSAGPTARQPQALEAAGPPPFNLTRWFTVVASVCIVLVAAASALIQSKFLREHLLQRDAEVSAAFVQSIAGTQQAATYFSLDNDSSAQAGLEEFFDHIAAFPDVLRANVYSRDGRVLWSSDPALMGRKFNDNRELEQALAGRIVIESGDVEALARKLEHLVPQWGGRQFVELYLPVRETTPGPVIGVVEVYRVPDALFATVRAGMVIIWTSAFAGAALLFAALFWLVRRASRTIDEQQRRIVEAESLAVVGEMSTVVAHGIRNPLASIRSSAELIDAELPADPAPGGPRESARDIIEDVDRLEEWVRSLLTYAQPAGGPLETVQLEDVVRVALQGFAREFERRDVRLELQLDAASAGVHGNRALLAEVLNNLISNALDAMPRGGRLRLSSRALDPHRVEIAIADTGVGIPPERLRHAFTPFFTTKGRGMGLGLPLSQRILRRCGGDIALDSTAGAGTTVRLQLQIAH